MQTDKCGRRGVGLPEWSCCHVAIAAAVSGFLGVGSTIGRILRAKEMGQNRTLPQLKDRRSDLPCSNYMPCVGE